MLDRSVTLPWAPLSSVRLFVAWVIGITTGRRKLAQIPFFEDSSRTWLEPCVCMILRIPTAPFKTVSAPRLNPRHNFLAPAHACFDPARQFQKLSTRRGHNSLHKRRFILKSVNRRRVAPKKAKTSLFPFRPPLGPRSFEATLSPSDTPESPYRLRSKAPRYDRNRQSGRPGAVMESTIGGGAIMHFQ